MVLFLSATKLVVAFVSYHVNISLSFHRILSLHVRRVWVLEICSFFISSDFSRHLLSVTLLSIDMFLFISLFMLAAFLSLCFFFYIFSAFSQFLSDCTSFLSVVQECQKRICQTHRTVISDYIDQHTAFSIYRVGEAWDFQLLSQQKIHNIRIFFLLLSCFLLRFHSFLRQKDTLEREASSELFFAPMSSSSAFLRLLLSLDSLIFIRLERDGLSGHGFYRREHLFSLQLSSLHVSAENVSTSSVIIFQPPLCFSAFWLFISSKALTPT